MTKTFEKQQLVAEPAKPEAEPQQPVRPEIWIGSAADFAGDQSYGDWVDPAQLPADLFADIRKIVDRTPDRAQASWGVHDLRGFGSWQPSEQDALPAYVLVARGIREHGLAFAALAKLVGADSPAVDPARFRLSFVGEYASVPDFVRQFAAETGLHDYFNRLPVAVRPFFKIDYAAIWHEARKELDVVQHERGFWVFDPRRW